MKVYLVGGAVRDTLCGLVPKDRDWVVVGATDADVAAMLAEGYTQVGQDFPVFLHPVTNEEYALARFERKTGNGHKGFTVIADSSVTLVEDLERRDLTMNSMAMDMESGEVADPFHGRLDMQNKILRHTSPAFSEDPLRVLRLARFSARFPEFTISQDTIDLCKRIGSKGELNQLSSERIWTELNKGLCSDEPHHFLNALVTVGAMQSCTVLSDIFGKSLSVEQHGIAEELTAVSEDMRLPVAIGLLAQYDAVLTGASSRTDECAANVAFLRDTDRDPAMLHTLMKKSRAMSDGTAFPDFLTAVQTRELAKLACAFTSQEIAQAAGIMRAVKASEFPSLDGKALGAAIQNERIRQLDQLLDRVDFLV